VIPLAKNIKRYFSLKEFAVVLLAVVISVSAGVVVFNNLKKEVLIYDSGKQILVKTMKTTVKDVLEQARIKIGTEDYISLPLNERLHKTNSNEIHIKRAVPIEVTVEGQKKIIMTYMDTVKEALTNSSVKLLESDRLEGAKPDDKVVKGMKIKLIRVRQEYVSEEEAIPYKVITKENHTLDKGVQRPIREGKEGVREKLFKVVMEDGKAIAKELVKETVKSNPVDRIVECGTVLNHKTSRGDVVRYKKVMNMRATSYTSSYADTGKSPGHPEFGITYTGVKARKGIIAVDPRVIPLGTRVYVEVAGNTPDYGYAVAADIGGAIKGDLIDLYFDDQATVSSWGCKKVKVYILLD
jgi:uncharacterized protein YabE (DUF348 family)